MTGPEPLPTIPGYRVLNQLGSGGMGAVYLARRSDLAAPVAIKVMKASLAAEDLHVRRFWREVRVLMLQQHPGIVQLVDAGRTEDGRLYLATRLVDGRDLFAIIQRGRSLPLELWLSLADQLLAAVAAAHQLVDADDQPLQIVHRDLKPENVMIDWSGRVVVLDFGLAQIRAAEPGSALTRPGQVMGTPKYMSPEQIAEPHLVGPRTDQFAAAVLLYHAAVGRTVGSDLPNGDDAAPLADLWVRLLEPDWPPLSTRAPHMPERLDRVLAKALAPSPTDRFGSVARFREELLRVAHQAPAPAAGLGLHVQRLFPGEVSETGAADFTRVSSEPTALRPSPSVIEATRYGPLLEARPPRRGPAIARSAALVAGFAGVIGGLWGVFAATEREIDRESGRGSVIAPGGAAERPAPSDGSLESEVAPRASPVRSRPADPTLVPLSRASAERAADDAAPSAAGPAGRPGRAQSPSTLNANSNSNSNSKRPVDGGARAARPASSRPSPSSAAPAPPTPAPPTDALGDRGAWTEVEAALARGDETAAARRLRRLEGHVPDATWRCIVQALKTKRAQDVVRSCR